ncbi:MAG: hypothetical protein AUK34_07895 [Ignavibacteria bacterium CG2_30_36_16]|nr:DUF4878 domain-containing protein [Ignavibacteria bacterium]OIP59444.1 MAG: hypothetical protein AUK34_07895 [Ignavibacteria bacterium CG2_30_36_16]PJB01834.1 MAG: hypothetical protein CO127_01830 [Ignavibacteria bacterium CG_4_9_14_3_um_filter_36_18]
MKKMISFSLLILFSFTLMKCGSSPGPGDTVKEFFDAAENNNVEAASNLLAPELKTLLGEKKLEKALGEQSKEIKEKGGISDIEIFDEKIEETSATLKFKITYGNGEVKEDKAKLIKTEDGWKIGASK